MLLLFRLWLSQIDRTLIAQSLSLPISVDIVSMTSRLFNVGIIGYGMSAKVFHLPLISGIPELKLYAIVQRTPKPNDDAEKDHPEAKIFRSGEEMIRDKAVDVVLVLTTPTTHFDLTKFALESGKHGTWYWPLPNHYLIMAVVVEKPFTPTSKEAYELIAIAEKNQRLLTVYQSMSNKSKPESNVDRFQTEDGMPTSSLYQK